MLFFRFFQSNNGGPPVNPPSGSVIDDVVTLPERYDFYLVSQSVRQGTVNPTSYNIVENTTSLTPDHFQVRALCTLFKSKRHIWKTPNLSSSVLRTKKSVFRGTGLS